MSLQLDTSIPFSGKDLTGSTFGRLNVIGFAGHRLTFPNSKNGKPNRMAYWKCKCECGNERFVCVANLTVGGTKSCGCLQRENTSKRNFKHGLHSDPIYRIWAGIIQRCLNSKCWAFRWYGGRGIKVCDRWREFKHFHADMKPSWKPGLSIERKNNNGDYCPENCCWVTPLAQARNRRFTKAKAIRYFHAHCL